MNLLDKEIIEYLSDEQLKSIKLIIKDIQNKLISKIDDNIEYLTPAQLQMYFKIKSANSSKKILSKDRTYILISLSKYIIKKNQIVLQEEEKDE